MVRTYFTALVALLALVSAPLSFGFGLGEITLKSYLNQPFVAEIAILDKGDLTEEEIIPKLASPKDFSNVGLQRNFFLTRLKFQVVFGKDRDYVRVTSVEPVTEPYLDFLVEFLWPEGRLLREYTVLLDPPSYASQLGEQSIPVIQGGQEPAPVVQTQATQAPQSETQQATVTTVDTQATATPPTEQTESQTVPAQRRTVQNAANETLWSIASRERPDESLSVQQTMLAIKELNPEAFEHNNINYLKKNQILRMPTEQEIRALATREAMGIVADQNREWAGRTLAQGGTVPVDTAKLVGNRQLTPMDDVESSGDSLRLVADSGEEGEAIGLSGGEGTSANADEVARALRENQRLSQDLQNLKSQVETTERLLSLKDQQIAELQARLEQEGMDSSTALDEELEQQVIERVAVAEAQEELETQVAEEEAGFEAESGPEDALQDEVASGSDDMSFEADTSAASTSLQTESSQALQSSSTGQQQDTASSGLFGNSMMLAIIGVLVLLVLAGVGFFLYKKRTSATPQSSDDYAYGADDQGDEGFEGFPEGFGDQEDAFGEDAFAGLDDGDGGDLLTAAQAYISHERWDKAIDQLVQAINDGDERLEVKMALLEAYAGAGDRNAFKSVRADVLTEDPGLESQVDQLAIAFDDNSSTAMDMDATTRMDASDFDLDAGAEDEFDISLDDLANDLDASFSGAPDDEAKNETVTPAEDDGETLDLGSELDDLEDSLGLEESHGESSADVELDLDLDLDFEDEDDEQASADDAGAGLDDTLILNTDESEDDGSLELDDFNFDEEENSVESADTDLSEGLDDDLVDLSSESSESSDDDFSFELEEESSGEDDGISLEFDDEESTDDGGFSLELDDEEDGASADEFSLEEESGGELGESFELDTDLSTEEEPSLELENDEDASASEDIISLDEDDDFSLDLDEEADDELDLDSLDLDSDEALDLSEAEVTEEAGAEPEASESDDSLFEGADDDEFELPEEGDEAATKLDLARAYIDMGDEEGAKDILEEVLAEGDDSQKAEAKALMEKL